MYKDVISVSTYQLFIPVTCHLQNHVIPLQLGTRFQFLGPLKKKVYLDWI